MSKVLPVEVHDRPELNLRQGIKSSLNSWRQLIVSMYLFYQYTKQVGDDVYGKEIVTDNKITLDLIDGFAEWLGKEYGGIPNIKERVRKSPLFSSQLEPLQVGVELFLKIGKIKFVDSSFPDAKERTGGNRFAKRILFSTNMKVLADVVSLYGEDVKNDFIDKWLDGKDDSIVSFNAKEVIVTFTEECQYKLRTSDGEVFFQQDGIYESLRDFGNTVVNTDVNELVGPFRVLKSFVREEMHPYIKETVDGFAVKEDKEGFIKYADMVQASLSLIPKRTVIYETGQCVETNDCMKKCHLSRQLITYGAPGTGKSHGVEEVVGSYENTVRTTFHPDSDYSTFVGCYKPTMEAKPKYGPQGLPIKVNGVELTEDIISYSYVPQAFTKAYVRAWKSLTPDSEGKVSPQFLVIEEINRGNCAQIFGDLFQLLDRDDGGYSKYAIEADSDLARHISKELANAEGDIPENIRKGTILRLPPNLYIWATMNTSDQSLFPMDSAFKRRWEWRYVPIRDAGKNWKIVSEKFDWWEFIKKVNGLISSATNSEDKQLGYFFARPDDASGNVISASRFVNKVLFYLYNDVFKDYDLPQAFSKQEGGRFAFGDFFLDNGEADEDAVNELLSGIFGEQAE